jgi:hypothetical protein
LSSGQPQRAGEAWFQFTVDGGVGHGSGDAVADSAESVDARRASFARYLAEGPPVSVDVWDAESLMQVGTCELDVSPLLRGGRDATDALVEAIVVDHRQTSLAEKTDSATDPRRTNEDPRRRQIGALLVRLINVGRRGRGGDSGDAGPATATDALSREEEERKKRTDSRRAGFPLGRPRGVVARGRRPGVSAPTRRLERIRIRIRIDSTARRVERRRGESVAAKAGFRERKNESGDETSARAGSAEKARDALLAQETRKLAREARLREIRGEGADAFARGDASRPSPSPDPKLEASARLAVRAKLLESVEAARRRAKREAVLRKLRETSEFKKTVRPRFGELCFFEHPFRNGSASEGVFEIRCDDPDIVLVTSSAERARLRTLASVTDATYDEEVDETNI